jgi:hypothetical protein
MNSVLASSLVMVYRNCVVREVYVHYEMVFCGFCKRLVSTSKYVVVSFNMVSLSRLAKTGEIELCIEQVCLRNSDRGENIRFCRFYWPLQVTD